MVELHINNETQISQPTGLEASKKAEATEAGAEKTLRQQQQRVFVQTMTRGAFFDENLKGMLDMQKNVQQKSLKKCLPVIQGKGFHHFQKRQ